jgi:hypothetical protein
MSVLSLRIPCQPRSSTAGPPSGPRGCMKSSTTVTGWSRAAIPSASRSTPATASIGPIGFPRSFPRCTRFAASPATSRRWGATSTGSRASTCCATARARPQAFLYAFDLTELDGEDLRAVPLKVRKARLARLVIRAKAGLQLVEHIEGDGR